MESKILKYADDILTGKIDSCEFVQLCITRHFEDLKKDWEYYFNAEEGLRWVKLSGIVVLYDGDMAGIRMVPELWEQWLFYCAFGWRRKDSKKRRFKYMCIVCLPRFRGRKRN